LFQVQCSKVQGHGKPGRSLGQFLRYTLNLEHGTLNLSYVIEIIPGVRLTSGSPPLSLTSTQPPQLVSKLPSALETMGFTIKTFPFSIRTSRLRAPRFCGVKSGPSSP